MHLCVLTRFPQAREKICPLTKTPSPARVNKGFHSFCGEQNRDEIPAGDGNAAEHKRSRSEVNTGRRIGSSFGLCLFFRRENRIRFSRRAGPSRGLWVGLSCWSCFCGSQSRRACALGLWPTPRARSPNPTELGRGWWPGLGLYSRTRPNSTECDDKMRGGFGRCFCDL